MEFILNGRKTVFYICFNHYSEDRDVNISRSKHNSDRSTCIFLCHLQSVNKVIHYGGQTGEGQNWDQSKRKLLGERGEMIETFVQTMSHRRLAELPRNLNTESIINNVLTCKLWSTLRKSFIPVKCWTSWKMATRRVGMMAMERVSSTRAKRDHLRFRKPWTKKEDIKNVFL